MANYLTNFANNILASHPSRNANLFAPFVFGHRLIEANYLRASPAAPRDSFVYFAIPSIDMDRCWRPAKCIHLRSFRYQKWTRNKKIKRFKRQNLLLSSTKMFFFFKKFFLNRGPPPPALVHLGIKM